MRGLGRIDEQFVGNTRVSLLRDGNDAYPAMLAAIERACRQVLVEMYWFASDKIGQRFADVLAAKARSGVEVLLLYDSVGSLGTSTELFDALRAAGVRVFEFNPVSPWHKRFRLDRLKRRDHRKIIVVDGERAFTGGINIADQWLTEAEGGGGWRDDAIELEGPAAEQLRLLFERTWVGQRQGALRVGTVTREGEVPTASTGVRVLGEYGRKNRRQIRRAYLNRIWHAQKRIWLANAYFVPDRVVRQSLARAARRGVDVRVIVPAVSDVPAVTYAGRATYGSLMSAGVRIFERQGNVFHAKTAVVDSRWSTVGSYNMDYWSFRYNLEVNVAVENPSFGAAMEASFESDLGMSVEILQRDFRYRSLQNRLLEKFFYFFRHLL